MGDLGVVVGKSDCGERARGEYGNPDEPVAQVGPEERRHNNRDNNQQSTHGRGPGFFLMSLRAFLPDVLPDLEITQTANHQGTDNESGEKSREAGEGGAEGDVAKDAEGRDVVLQLEE